MPNLKPDVTLIVRLYLRCGATIVLVFTTEANARNAFDGIESERRRKATGLLRIVGEEGTQTLASVEREAIEAVTLTQHGTFEAR